MNSRRSLAGLLGWTAITSGLNATIATARRSSVGEALVLGGGLVDRERGGGGEDGVAVGGRAAHRLGREIAAGAAAIFHHDRMPEALAELLPHHAGDDVGNAAGREGDHEGDVLRRIGLRGSGRREAGNDESADMAARRAMDNACMACPFVTLSFDRIATAYQSIAGNCTWIGLRRHASGIGVHSTCSMRVAPVASMTSRSNPSAIPQACGMTSSAPRKSSSIG